MPETSITVQLPDGSQQNCYSPSTVVRNYFSSGEELPVEEFLIKARKALNEASARVEAKFGFSCSGASASLANIESWGQQLSPTETVKILSV